MVIGAVVKNMQTGSTWSQAVTRNTGMCEDDICDLCKEAKETSNYIWYSERLKCRAKELDQDLLKPIKKTSLLK